MTFTKTKISSFAYIYEDFLKHCFCGKSSNVSKRKQNRCNENKIAHIIKVSSSKDLFVSNFHTFLSFSIAFVALVMHYHISALFALVSLLYFWSEKIRKERISMTTVFKLNPETFFGVIINLHGYSPGSWNP